MYDHRIGPCRDNALRERVERLLRVLVVDADAALHRHRHTDNRLHRGDAFADQLRHRHQAGAETAILHAVRRTADVEIDLIVTVPLVSISVYSFARRVSARWKTRHRLSVQSIIGAIENIILYQLLTRKQDWTDRHYRHS